MSHTFRKKKCKGFWANGCCLYGMRCQFGHASGSNWENGACLEGLKAWSGDEEGNYKTSSLLKILKVHK